MPDSPNDTSTVTDGNITAPNNEPQPESYAPPAAEASAPAWERLAEQLQSDLTKVALEFLARSAPSRELWQLLSQSQHAALQISLTRGFQRTAAALRQPPVRARLVKAMSDDAELTFTVLQLWAATDPAPLVVVREIANDDELAEKLSQLWQRFGTEALLWSLFLEQRRAVLESWTEKLLQGELAPPSEESQPAPEEPALAPTQPSGEALLAKAQSDLAKWQSRAQTAEEKLHAAEAALIAARSQHAKEVQELRAQANQHENRYDAEHKRLEETDKNLDRTARRLKHAEKQLEELESENKKLKKQVRLQQELSEESKKEAAGLRAQIETLKSEPPVSNSSSDVKPNSAKAPSTDALPSSLHFTMPAATVAPHDQQFVWTADGRTMQVTPREIKRAIDNNDEQFVFTLIQATDALRQISPEGWKLLLDRMREFDRYYANVLTQHTTRILVDASNVARYEKNRFGKGQVRLLAAMREELRRRNCFPIRFIADASLPYNVDFPDEIAAMVKRGEMEMSATGQEADEILAREARRSGAFVVSNDRTFHHKVSPGFEPPRVGFQFYDRYVVVDEF